MKKKKLLVISGSSGVGKGTVLREVLKNREDIKYSVSCTTRNPRDGEINGQHYFFLSKEKFLNGDKSLISVSDNLRYFNLFNCNSQNLENFLGYRFPS